MRANNDSKKRLSFSKFARGGKCPEGKEMQSQKMHRSINGCVAVALKFVIGIIFGLGVWQTSAIAQGHAPIRLHPANPHVFEFRGRPTVLVTSAEHYGAVMNAEFNYDIYLAELQRHGFNLTRLFSGMYAETWGEPWNTLNPASGKFLSPYKRSSTPGFKDGGNKFDLDQWDDEYFARLKDFVRKAGKAGIVVEMTLFCVFYGEPEWSISPYAPGNNVNGFGNFTHTDFWKTSNTAAMARAEALTKKIVTELKEFDNVYFELNNEPWIGGPRHPNPWNDRIIAAIQSVDKSHLIAINLDAPAGNAIPAGISILNYHYASPPNAVATNWGLNMVTSFDESGFRQSGPDNYRKEAWDFIIAGGAVYDNLDWSFSVASPEGKDKGARDNLGPKAPELRDQLAILLKFMNGFDVSTLKPNKGIVKGGAPATFYALADAGRAYAIYLNGGSKSDLQLDLPQGNYGVEWVDTKSGAITKSAINHGGGTVTISSPNYSQDIALAIKVNGYTAPSSISANPGPWTLSQKIQGQSIFEIRPQIFANGRQGQLNFNHGRSISPASMVRKNAKRGQSGNSPSNR